MKFQNIKIINIFLIFILISCGEKPESPNQNDTNTNSNEENQKEALTNKTPEQLLEESKKVLSKKDTIIEVAKDSSKTIIEAANDSSKIIIEAANDSSETIIEAANVTSKTIIEAANDSSKIIIKAKSAKAEIRQEFLEKNSLLILAILTLLVIVFLSTTGLKKLDHLNNEWIKKLDHLFSWREKVNNNTVELPEIFISDWNKLSKSIELLTKRVGEVEEKDKDLANLTQKLRLNITSFAEKINTNTASGLNEVVDNLEPLKKQLVLQKEYNEQLKDGYDLNTRKRFTLELIGIKDLIDHCLKADLVDSIKDINQISQKIGRFFEKNEIYVIQNDDSKSLVDFQSKNHEKIDEVITTDNSKEGKISSVEKVGYYFKDLQGNKIIIRKAKVSIYVLRSKKK